MQLAPSSNTELQVVAANDNRGERLGRATSIGELSGKFGLSELRSGRQSRRNSYPANDRRIQGVWKPLGKPDEVRRIAYLVVKTAEAFDRHLKAPGQRNGPLGHVALEILRELWRKVDYKTGRLDPALGTICVNIGRSRASVVNGLKRLQQHGFVNWVRRTEPTQRSGKGPQLRQITNAYWLIVPAPVAEWITRQANPAPIPECELGRHRIAQKEFEGMLDQISAEEQLPVIVESGNALMDALLALARAHDRSHASSPNSQNPNIV